jgi:DnaK suppressor protein
MDISSYKQRLEERLRQIEEGDVARKDDRKPVELDQTTFGRLSRMDAMQQQAMSQAAGRMAQVEKQRIKAALRRIEEDEYGYCVLCGEDIAEKRLNFDPSVPTCIECAEQAERRR